jgi:hypothetical protein
MEEKRKEYKDMVIVASTQASNHRDVFSGVKDLEELKKERSSDGTPALECAMP